MPRLLFLALSLAAVAAGAFSISTPAADMAARLDQRAPARADAKPGPELIPGAHLMTPAERDQYRQAMQAAKSPKEKARIRAEHVQAIDQRARSVGLTLNKEPVAVRGAGDSRRGSALHDVCFSCHGPERYTAAKERASSFLASAVATASGVEDLTIAQAAARRPDTLPAGYPRMGRSQVKNIAGLKQAVARWNDYFSPKLTENELDDLVAYLNAAYYKF